MLGALLGSLTFLNNPSAAAFESSALETKADVMIQSQQQGSIAALIIDQSTKSPINSASVALLDQQTRKILRTTQTDAKGILNLTGVEPGLYTVQVAFMGYSRVTKENVRVAAGQKMDLGRIEMQVSGEVIEEVVIEATTPSMQLGIDRKIFNVAESTISVGGNAIDLLSNIPSLQVDMDGSIQLRGSNNVKVLIDGKESSMAGSDVSHLLRALPAGSVERVELITNPSSRYDAEGQSGIINIVLKKEQRLGFNGSFDLSGGSYNNYSAGLNLNFRDHRFNYYGGYSFNRRNSIGGGLNTTRIFESNTLTHNTSDSERLGLNNTVKLGVDYYLADQTSIGLSGNVSIRDNSSGEDIFYRYENHPSLTGTSTRTSTEEETDSGYDLNLDFMHTFKENKGNIMANLGFGYDGEDETNNFFQDYQPISGAVPSEERLNENEEFGRKYNAQIDITRQLNDSQKLDYGFRSHIRTSKDRQFSRVPDDEGVFVPDYSVSNDFRMVNQVHALYANYQHQFTESFGLQAGLRAEQAYLNTDFLELDPSVSLDERTVKGELNYFRLYPSLYLTQAIGEENQVQLSYSRRVNRPRGWQINPFVDISDPLNISQGNPNLRPEDVHSFELSYANFWQNFVLTSSVYHRAMNDIVQSVITEVSGNDGATFSRWENISSSGTTGFELISKMDFTKNFDLATNVNAYHTRFAGSPEHDIEPSEGFSWNGNMTGNLRITPTFSAQARFEYQAPRVMAQGKGIENYVIDAGLRLDLFDKKASIMFNARDLLDQRRWGGYTETEHLYRYSESRWMRRSFTVSLSYRFGNQNFNLNKRKQNDDLFDGGDDF